MRKRALFSQKAALFAVVAAKFSDGGVIGVTVASAPVGPSPQSFAAPAAVHMQAALGTFGGYLQVAAGDVMLLGHKVVEVKATTTRDIHALTAGQTLEDLFDESKNVWDLIWLKSDSF